MKKLKEIHGYFLKDCCEEDESEQAREKRKTFQAIQEILEKKHPEDMTKGNLRHQAQINNTKGMMKNYWRDGTKKRSRKQ
jgi:hypothetical protein